MENRNHVHSEAHYLFQQLNALLPNLERNILLYKPNKSSEYKALETNYHEGQWQESEAMNYFTLAGVEQLFGSKLRHQWLSTSSLPWRNNEHTIAQREVFSEIENVVLLLRLRPHSNGNSYVFLLFFNPDASNFGPVLNDEVLSTASKSVIENLIFRFLIHEQKQHVAQLQQFHQFKKYLSRLKDKAKSNAAKANNLSQNSEDLRLDFAHYILKGLQEKFAIDIAFSASATNLIKSYENSFATMEYWIKQAFEFARFTDFNPENSMLIMDEWHFEESHLHQQSNSSAMEQESTTDQRLMKAFALMNRIEKAAHKVAAERQKLTSAAVGQAMEPPITAPAISDAFKKNKRKILKLLEQFPNHWTLIRNEFRPLVNLQDQSSSWDENRKVS